MKKLHSLKATLILSTVLSNLVWAQTFPGSGGNKPDDMHQGQPAGQRSQAPAPAGDSSDAQASSTPTPRQAAAAAAERRAAQAASTAPVNPGATQASSAQASYEATEASASSETSTPLARQQRRHSNKSFCLQWLRANGGLQDNYKTLASTFLQALLSYQARTLTSHEVTTQLKIFMYTVVAMNYDTSPLNPHQLNQLNTANQVVLRMMCDGPHASLIKSLMTAIMTTPQEHSILGEFQGVLHQITDIAATTEATYNHYQEPEYDDEETYEQGYEDDEEAYEQNEAPVTGENLIPGPVTTRLPENAWLTRAHHHALQDARKNLQTKQQLSPVLLGAPQEFLQHFVTYCEHITPQQINARIFQQIFNRHFMQFMSVVIAVNRLSSVFIERNHPEAYAQIVAFNEAVLTITQQMIAHIHRYAPGLQFITETLSPPAQTEEYFDHPLINLFLATPMGWQFNDSILRAHQQQQDGAQQRATLQAQQQRQLLAQAQQMQQQQLALQAQQMQQQQLALQAQQRADALEVVAQLEHAHLARPPPWGQRVTALFGGSLLIILFALLLQMNQPGNGRS